MTGHLLGAAGAIEAIACIQALQHNLVPPTINTTSIEPDIKDKYHLPLHTAAPRSINYAMSNTFGFGGHIATTIFKSI